MSGIPGEVTGIAARRLEELALNASGAFQSLIYDGWLLGYRRGRTKRLRCVNPFYPSSLPVQEKIDHCEGDHAGLFAVHTAERHRGRGFGRVIVTALLAEAMRLQARFVYLQVTAGNAAALALYRHFGFTTAYDYWYRATAGEQG